MRPPLSGIRVVDFGWVWAGAVPGQILAFLGAEVIKVESAARLDSMRRGLPLVGDKPDPEQQPMFHNVNRGKLSVTIDMSLPEGRDLARELASKADVVIENFAPGVMDRLGLAYGVLAGLNPGVVMLSLSGGGQTGSLRAFKSYAATIAAYVGMDSVCGYPGEEPLGIQQPYLDPNASLYGALGILAALRERSSTGRGAHIDLSQVDAGLATVGEGLYWLQSGAELPVPLGNSSGNPSAVIEDIFRCQGDDWVAVSIPTSADAKALAAFLGAEGEDPVTLRNALGDWCARRTSIEAMEALQSADIDAGAVTSAESRFTSDHFRSRGTYQETEHPVIGWEVVYRVPWLAEPPAEAEEIRRAPLLGEHTEYVITEVLGRSREDFAKLVEQGVLK